jgi:mannose-6-phosphate isomerase-like protein (cupin superfamily)
MAKKVRRVVTAHDKSGKAVIAIDGAPKRVVTPPGGITDTLLWVTDATPAAFIDDKDGGDRSDVGIPPPAAGSIFRIVEFAPEKDAPPDEGGASLQARIGGADAPVHGAAKPRHPGMHRTRSIDYAIVMEGEIDMMLDDSEVHLKAGDVLVQQGTNHAWVNRGDKPCVVAFVLIGAEREGPKS